jgi:CMP-N-acetylneuraminic acid synthetase
MINAIIIGRGGSTGLPGKNIMKILGRPLMHYPILAALNSKEVNNIYLSTDDKEIAAEGQRMGCKLIIRPNELATKEALAEHAFIHAFNEIKKNTKDEMEAIVLLFCNGATLLSKYIDEGVQMLRDDQSLDSVATASSYNMWSPLRARKLDENNILKPFIEPSYFGNEVNCDRGSQGDCWYADCSMFVVRPYCMDSRNGFPPFQWLGKKVKAIKQWGGLDIDYFWQVPIVEMWLKEHGFSEESTPY